ncbi:antiterminator Q family protein [Orbus wheelerorum]|uniref:antiterminator Q family protein n=1 Tax=Orbus wheelerorum TaxID=3074111 RepID=UPI00370D4150
MLVNEYVEVQTVSESKPVTQVHFNSDYDITDVLDRWGNWARKEAYLQRKAFSLFKSEQGKFKNSLCDDDALIVDSVIAHLGKMKTKKSQDEFKVLKLYYFGEVTMLDDTVMIITQSLRAIAKITGIEKRKVMEIKSNAESCIIGMLAMQTMLTGMELELLQNIKLLK